MRWKRDVPSRRVGAERVSEAGNTRRYWYAVLTACEQADDGTYAVALRLIREQWDRRNATDSPAPWGDRKTLERIRQIQRGRAA